LLVAGIVAVAEEEKTVADVLLSCQWQIPKGKLLVSSCFSWLLICLSNTTQQLQLSSNSNCFSSSSNCNSQLEQSNSHKYLCLKQENPRKIR
jgi:hypothetical protein